MEINANVALLNKIVRELCSLVDPLLYRHQLKALGALLAQLDAADAEVAGTLAAMDQYKPPDCRNCGKPLVDFKLADGCPCNAVRGINHGLVPKDCCTCAECDPAQTGSSRIRPVQPPAERAGEDEAVQRIYKDTPGHMTRNHWGVESGLAHEMPSVKEAIRQGYREGFSAGQKGVQREDDAVDALMVAAMKKKEMDELDELPCSVGGLAVDLGLYKQPPPMSQEECRKEREDWVSLIGDCVDKTCNVCAERRKRIAELDARINAVAALKGAP